VTPLTISPSIPINLNAVNNGPIAPGNQLILSIGSVSNASYAWTDKDGNSVGASRMVLRPDFTPNMAGKYSVTVTTAGCNSTKTTDVESLECKVFIASTNLDTGEETYKLARLPNQTDTFAPLKLSLSNYDGTTDFSAYRIEWYHDGNLMPGKIQPTLTTALIGEYTARTTLKVNPDTFCETTVTLSGTPCKDIPEAAPEDCDATYSVPAPDALASGITLSAGDEFTAGDFLVTVTQITSGDKAGWNGEGYVTIKMGGLVELKRLAVTFDAAVVNSCYELSAGGVKTTYDPSWSNILDVDAVIEDFKALKNQLTGNYVEALDLINNLGCNEPKDIAQLKSLVLENEAIKAQINSLDYLNGTEKNDYENKITSYNTTINCFVNACEQNTPISACSKENLKTGIEDLEDIVELLLRPRDIVEAFGSPTGTSNSSSNARLASAASDCSYPLFDLVELADLKWCDNVSGGGDKVYDAKYFGSCGSQGNGDVKIFHLGETDSGSEYFMVVAETETYYLYIHHFSYNYSDDCRTAQIATKTKWYAECGQSTPCPDLWNRHKLEWGSNIGDDAGDAINYTFVAIAVAFTGAQLFAIIGRTANYCKQCQKYSRCCWGVL
jgi:hypothetical protein